MSTENTPDPMAPATPAGPHGGDTGDAVEVANRLIRGYAIGFGHNDAHHRWHLSQGHGNSEDQYAPCDECRRRQDEFDRAQKALLNALTESFTVSSSAVPTTGDAVEALSLHRTVLSITDQEYRCEHAACAWSTPLIPGVDHQSEIHDRAHIVAALAEAGFLATEQEWEHRCDCFDGVVTSRQGKYAESGECVNPVNRSRRVTAWRDQA